jgi:hypothetical protein
MNAEKTKNKNYKKFAIAFWILFAGPIIGVLLFVLGIRLFADLPDTEELQNPKTLLAIISHRSLFKRHESAW